MAKIETWWRRPVCTATVYTNREEAEECAKNHVYSEQWAVSEAFPGKAVKVTRNRGIAQALQEAEEPDNATTCARKGRRTK